MSKKACENESVKVSPKEGKYKCKKCGASTIKEKHLCKPTKTQ
ncbi:MAG: hypothetical protein PHI36_05015 [Bacteroidales bacterium]|nr:hypothetical protein [Bacteroidales bacterium]